MTPQEFADALKSLGLKQKDAAPLLGYGNAARVSDICRGVHKPSGAVVLLLRAYLDGYRPKGWPFDLTPRPSSH